MVTNPEQLLKVGGGFEKLFKDADFVACLSSIVFDEAHCISEWGLFRPEYKEIGRLRYQAPHTPFVFASATFTTPILSDIKHKFGLDSSNTTHIQRHTDRPNIHLGVQRIKHPLHTFADLMFFVDGELPPPKFIIFFNSIAESVNAGNVLRRRLPHHLRNKISWYNSDMSLEFKHDELECFRRGEIWELCATDSFGMVRRQQSFDVN